LPIRIELICNKKYRLLVLQSLVRLLRNASDSNFERSTVLNRNSIWVQSFIYCAYCGCCWSVVFILRLIANLVIRSESGKCSGRRRLGLQHLAVIVLADDTSVDHSVPVAGNQSVVTRGAREARHVIDASLSFHYEFIGGNCHPTGATRTSRTEQSRTPAQHKSFANEVCLF